jgi:putative transposase
MQCRDIRTRFFTGTRVYNAVLGEFIARGRAVKSDPAWVTARPVANLFVRDRKKKPMSQRVHLVGAASKNIGT